MNILRVARLTASAPKDAKMLCFAPSGFNSKWRYLFGSNTFHDVIDYLCTRRQLPVNLAYSRFRDESKPAKAVKNGLVPSYGLYEPLTSSLALLRWNKNSNSGILFLVNLGPL